MPTRDEHRKYLEEQILALLNEEEREILRAKLAQLNECSPLAEVRSWEPTSVTPNFRGH